ncbi:MAG TPA: hypothetical protein VN922_01230, partial [Bacteroidia bacterium]|nr:hypothetical protein [Bacteroidia bacterium]
LCVVPLTAFLRIHNRWNTVEPGFNEDIYNHRTELRNAVPDNALCVIGDDESTYIYYYYLHKKGWSFANDYLPGDTLKAMISKGARYMYSDSRKLESDSLIHIHLDKLIMKQGTINVYSLK